MRIAYLTHQYPKVSHSFVRREIAGLEALGHTVLRFSVRPSDLALTPDPADARERERTQVLLDLPRGLFGLIVAYGRQLLRAPRQTLRVSSSMLRLGFSTGNGIARPAAYLLEAAVLLDTLMREQVLHLHAHFGSNAATVAWIVRRLGGPSFSMTIHGPAEWDAPRRNLLTQKLEAAAFTALISSHGVAQAKRWVGPEYWDRLHKIGCGVDASFFHAARPIDRAARFRFVSVGRLEAQKAPLLLLQAFAGIVSSGIDAELVLAGDGEFRSAIEAFVSAHRLEDRVELTGWITEAAVRDLVTLSHCFVLASVAEGLPVAIMEAMALERPVLSTYVAGIPELVLPGRNGWLVPAGDVSALESCLRDVVATPVDKLDAMGREGSRRVRARHDVSNEVTRLERHLRNAVAQPSFRL